MYFGCSDGMCPASAAHSVVVAYDGCRPRFVYALHAWRRGVALDFRPFHGEHAVAFACMDSAFGCSLWHGEGQWHCWCNAEKAGQRLPHAYCLAGGQVRSFLSRHADADIVKTACGAELLTLMPHAVLLSAVGRLFPSSFTNGLVPVLAFAVGAMSLTYGFMVGKLKTVYDAFLLMSGGVAAVAPLVVVYVFVAELYHSILFVFVI